MSQIVFAEEAWAEYIFWQSQDRKTVRRINQLLASIEREGPINGVGKPEKLKYQKGAYSRRIDDANRLVYSVSENQIVVKSCRGHYKD